jgi:hypothetical protein
MIIKCEIDCSNLYLPGHNEGFGSAFQLQLGAYALAKHCGVEFLLTPMKNVGHIQKFSFSQEEWDLHFFEYTRDFLLQDAITEAEDLPVIELGLYELLDTLMYYPDSLEKSIVNLDWTDLKTLIDHNIFLLNNIQEDLVKKYPIEKGSDFIISMHVRRSTEEDTDFSPWRRYYYPNVPNGLVDFVKEIMPTDKNVQFHIYSQGDISDFQYFNELDEYGKVFFHLDDHPVKTLDMIIKSDAFIMSKSSLSYIASVYHKQSYYDGVFHHTLTKNTINYNDKFFKSATPIELKITLPPKQINHNTI